MIARIKGIWPKFSTELSAAEYGVEFEKMEAEYSRELVDKAIDYLKRIRPDDPPSPSQLWDACADAKNESSTKEKLYDKNCPNCSEGWEEVGWSWFDSERRNKLIKLYGFEEAQRKTAVIRCRVCWKGPR